MIVHSFVNITPLINNTPGKVSPIGELSPNSKTFSREVGNYSSIQYPNVELVTFAVEDNDIAVTLPIGTRNQLLEMAEWVYSTGSDGNYTNDSSDFKQIFNVQYPNFSIEDLGRMETVNSVWYPTYIVFSIADQLYSLWFSDQEFDKEYHEYELFPIMPIDELDDLHGTRAEVFDLLDNVRVTDLFNRIDEVKNELPFTHQYPLEINWVDKNDPEVTKKITFVCLIYGNAGKNLDLIKNKLVEHILANSDYPRSEWEKILPELFLPNEFYISPMWSDIAVENLQSVNGIYSASSNFQQMMDYGVSTFFGLSETFIANNIEHAVSIYKSIGFVSIGNDKNQTGIYKFGELWPEFSTISTLDSYWNRLSPLTQGFLTELISCLSYAERWDGESYINLPNNYSTVERGGNTYIVFTYDKVNYLVSVRSNLVGEWTGNIGGTPNPEQPIPVPDIPFLKIHHVFYPIQLDSTAMYVTLIQVNPATGTETEYQHDGSIVWNGILGKDGALIDTEYENERYGEFGGGTLLFHEHNLAAAGYETTVTARVEFGDGQFELVSGRFISEDSDDGSDGGMIGVNE